MGFWNLIGGFALFNTVCDMLSSKPQQPRVPPPRPHHRRDGDADTIDDSDIDALQDRIDALEDQLDNCDMMSDRYDEIQDHIDELQDRLDKLELMRDLYED